MKIVFKMGLVAVLCGAMGTGCAHSSAACRTNGKQKIQKSTGLLDDVQRKIEEGDADETKLQMEEVATNLADVDAQIHEDYPSTKERFTALEGQVKAALAGGGAAAGIKPQEQQAKLDTAAQALKAAMAKLHEQEFAKENIEGIKTARATLDGALEEGKPLEVINHDYFLVSTDMYALRNRSTEEIKLGNRLAKFIEGQNQAAGLVKKAKTLKGKKKQKAALAKARDQYHKCHEGGQKLAESSPSFARAKFVIGGEEKSAMDLTSACLRKTMALERKVGRIKVAMK
jgi:hypothetical protein